MTQIESLIRRAGGTVVSMGDAVEIEFKPNKHLAHVADVEDPDHVAKLLAIPEGFRLYTGGAPGAAPKPLASAVTDAFELPTSEGGIVDYDALLEDDTAARSAYTKVFGRAPNARAKTETIVKHIRNHLTPVELPPDEDPVIPDDGQAAILSTDEQAAEGQEPTPPDFPPSGDEQDGDDD